jgi:hypothetical protein
VGSDERTDQPLSSHEQARGVWVDLAAVFGPPSSADAAPDGLVLETVPGGLLRWVKTTGGWVGVVTYVARMADGSTYKATDQLVPAHALRPR